MQLVVDFDLGDPRLDDFTCALVHRFGALDRSADQLQFIGVFVSSEFPEIGFEINEFRLVVEQLSEVWSAVREFDCHASGCGSVAECFGEGSSGFEWLFLAECGVPLSLEGDDAIGSHVLGGLVGCGEGAVAIGIENGCRAEQDVRGAETGQVLHVLGLHEDGSSDVITGEDIAESLLSLSAECRFEFRAG